MDKAYSRINWQDEPSVASPINAVNLNKMDSALNTIDNRVVQFDTSKANQSDLTASLRKVEYDQTSGTFTFTYWNGNTLTVDLNIEKIPVSFTMSAEGIITMINTDGTTYTADVGYLIKTYTFQDSDEINFHVTIDSSGNKTISASIANGSILGTKLQPNYLADIILQAQAAENSKLLAQSYANGTSQSRTDEETDNALYYKDQAKDYYERAAAVVGIDIATTSKAGIVKPDGETISVDATGKIGFAGVSDAEYDAISALLN